MIRSGRGSSARGRMNAFRTRRPLSFGVAIVLGLAPAPLLLVAILEIIIIGFFGGEVDDFVTLGVSGFVPSGRFGRLHCAWDLWVFVPILSRPFSWTFDLDLLHNRGDRRTFFSCRI